MPLLNTTSFMVVIVRGKNFLLGFFVAFVSAPFLSILSDLKFVFLSSKI